MKMCITFKTQLKLDNIKTRNPKQTGKLVYYNKDKSLGLVIERQETILILWYFLSVAKDFRNGWSEWVILFWVGLYLWCVGFILFS